MMINAKKRGVNLQIISFQRHFLCQNRVGFRRCSESNPDRLKTLTPPGFSEHHTGYVVGTLILLVDVTGGLLKGIKTKLWLKANASYYNFEQSFTREYSKAYGVSEEAWHWRWVGRVLKLK